MLIQRTILTGWLTLVERQFLRLLIALLVSIFFMVALLSMQCYRRKLDFGMAAGVQLLFVCIFVGGLLCHLYDISADAFGSSAAAYEFLGLHTTDEVVIFMICVALLMLILLAFTLGLEIYASLLQERLRNKWSVVTMDPPHVKSWKPRDVYGCFLSHYKVEAASEARYMHDVLRKMLHQPVFLGELQEMRSPHPRNGG